MVRPVEQRARPASRTTRPTRVEYMRRSLRQLFTGTSVVEVTTTPDGPKPSRPELALQYLSTTGILPRPSRAATAPATSSRSSSTASPDNLSAYTPMTSRPITPNSLRDAQRAMSLPLPQTRDSSRAFIGVDPEERYLADLAARGRRRQAKRARGGKRRRSCVINFKDRKVRSKIIACCFSAIFLLIILTICKSSATKFCTQNF